MKFNAAIQESEKLEAVTQELSDDLTVHSSQDEVTADLVHSANTQLEIQVNSLSQSLSQLELLSSAPSRAQSDS